MPSEWTRRELLGTAGLAVGTATVGAEEAPTRPEKEPFEYCLNTSTIREHKLTLPEEVDLAAEAGYGGIEPWIREIEAFRDAGGSLKDLAKQIRDHGLDVPSSIGFAQWIVDDKGERTRGLEQAKRDMDLVRAIGGTRIAAPPIGAHRGARIDLLAAAERYRALLEVGARMEIVPQVEVWGFSSSLSRLGEAVCVAVEAAHENACLLPDVYHIYKGGSGFEGLRLLGGDAIHVFHVNDYPADPPRATIKDADRVYPGDGVAPLTTIFRDLRAIGFRGVLSLELFNPTYWKQNPREVAVTGLRKTRDAVRAAFA